MNYYDDVLKKCKTREDVECELERLRKLYDKQMKESAKGSKFTVDIELCKKINICARFLEHFGHYINV